MQAEVEMLKPAEIYADIDSNPPLMQEDAKAKYLGHEVDWQLTFFSGSVEKNGQARLAFHHEPRTMGLVVGSVSLPDYPWLKSLRADEAVRVRGRICSVDYMAITLERLELSLPEPATLRG